MTMANGTPDRAVDDGDRRMRWHFDRRVTVGELLTALGLGLMIYFKINSVVDEFRTANVQMDKRVAILEEKAATQKQIDASQDTQVRDGQQRTREGQQRIEQSLGEIQRYLREPRATRP